ncbi:dexamethasone-induced Ras-related protein 1 [Megalops cyprinoides]|uniref:dexamethasone-induced Ras-related protein 1 n=1 Tax=Megalops cyprinoides TaxID=118141 RepID=UPI001864B18C|nr:dexamethasone-induced Ras-related protein 1 [Megalops cyprinoides]
MEAKTAKQANFTVEGATDTPCSCADPVVHRGCAYGVGQFPGSRAVCGGSSKVLLEYKNATQHLAASGVKVSTISKAGMGILKMATSHWRLQEKKARVVRSSSAGNRHPSSDRFPCKRSPLDQLEPGQDKLCSTKPQNCRRIVVLGAPRVGKTSILRRFLRDGFEERYEPTSEDFHRKLYHIRGETYQIDILDASGERAFPAKRRLSILTGDIFLLVFSVDDRGSFEEVRALRKEIVAAKSKLLKCKENARVPTIVCANKVDLDPKERVISHAEVCQELGEEAPYFETSAKDSTNLEEVFEALAKRGGLPTETGPSQHRKISIRSYQALRSGRTGGRGSRGLTHDIPCGALYPLARRPSFSTDLRQVLGPSATRKRGTPLEKCQIQ